MAGVNTVHVASNVWALRFPIVQAYVVRWGSGAALVDSGVAGSEQAVLGALRQLGIGPGCRTPLRQIVLTHCHGDHTGSAAVVAAATGAEVLAGLDDAPVIRGLRPEPTPVLPDFEGELFAAISPSVPPSPPTEVDRELSEGDSLDWGEPARILHVPGHTPGSLAVHLPASRFLFAGDTVAVVGGRPMLGVFNVDRALTVAAFRRLATLDVDTICAGHREVLVGGADAAMRAAAAAV